MGYFSKLKDLKLNEIAQTRKIFPRKTFIHGFITRVYGKTYEVDSACLISV